MKATNNTPATVNENKVFNVNIKDTVFIGKCQRMDWKAGRLVEIQGYTLEVGQKVLYAEAYGARSWWVCVSEPGGVNGRLQNIVEIGGEHRAMTWDVEHHDQSTADVFGIGLYYDNSGDRLTAAEIAKHVRAAEIQSRWNDRREANQKKAEAAERAALRQQWAGILTPLEDVKDWREREKTEKANILNYLKNRFPGVRFTARKSYGSFTISWTDGPSVSAVESACSVWHDHTFNGYEDYNEYTPTQFNRLFGGVEYAIDTNRKNSPEAEKAAREALADLCPELADLIGTGKDYVLNGAGQLWLDMTVNRRRDDEQARAFCEAGKYQAGRSEGHSSDLEIRT
jgi:glutathione S-transferase